MTSTLKVNTIAHSGGTNAMTIDSTGRLSQPAKPSFFAHGATASWQSVGAGGVVTELDATDHNIGGHYDTSNGRFTVPSGQAGKYYVYSQLMRNNFFNSRYLVKVRVNDTQMLSAEDRNTDTGGTTFQTVQVGGILDLSVGDYVSLISPNVMETAIGVLPIKQNFMVGGFFDIGMYEYDNNFIFIPWEKAESFLSTKQIAHGIEIFLQNPKTTESVYNELISKLDDNLTVIDWKKRNSSFMNALDVEKNVMFIILTLIILVATFNIISSMIMLVQTKKSDIALMRVMGASKNLIIRIFMLTGSIIGVTGTIIGAILGIIVSINIETIRYFISTLFGQELFSPQIYFLSTLPSNINFNEVLIVMGLSIFLTLIASIFPAWKASKISPAEALRYE